MPIYKTKDDMCRVYNERGGDTGQNITQAGTVLTVMGAKVNIPLRGLCWRIISPRVGYVTESEVREIPDTVPPPPPPPEPELEYLIGYFDNGTTKKYVPLAE